MGWFNNKKISVYSYSDELYDEYGVSKDGYTLKYEDIFVDIQPTGIEKIKKSYGYDIEANFEIYSDETLEESDIVLWNNKTYKIMKIISWDDYCISLIKQEDVKLNE